MRDFSKTFSQFWTGATGREIQGLGKDAVILAMYLFTSRHAHMFGIYYLPIAYIVHDTGLKRRDIEGALKGLGRVSEGGFMSYEAPSEWVWVHEMAKWQLLRDGEPLKEKDNKVEGYRKEYAEMPRNPFLLDFYEKYKDLLRLNRPRGDKPPERSLEGAPKPLKSPSEAKEREKEIERERESLARACEAGDRNGGIGVGKSLANPQSPIPKTPHGEFKNVMLTEVEYLTILARLGESEAENYIGQLSRRMAGDSKLAKKYTGHCATVLNWFKGKEGKEREYQRVCSRYNTMPKGGKAWSHPEAVLVGDEMLCPLCKKRGKKPEADTAPKDGMTDEERKKADEARERVKGELDKKLRRRPVGAGA